MTKVLGYKEQDECSVELVNGNKKLEELVLKLLDSYRDNENIDQRWLAIGRTNIEQGFMAVNRSIFKPERLVGTELA
jgi:hypothetical protein